MHALKVSLEDAYGEDVRNIDPGVAAYIQEILMKSSYIESTLYDAELYPLLRTAIEMGLVAENDVVALVEKSCPSVQHRFEERRAKGLWLRKESTEMSARRWMHRTLHLAGAKGTSSRSRMLLETE